MSKQLKRFFALAIALILLAGVINIVPVKAAMTVTIRADEVYQTIDGWGTSLCWWGNAIGGWNDSKEEEIVEKVFGSSGLGFNIVRYNIGGGENPSHEHMRDKAEIPGFKASASSPYDWNADENQRDVLLKAKAKGANIFEAFSNSPPYWMTKSGCSAGNTDGSSNLKDDMYDDFAEYLTEVVKHYNDYWGITFHTLAPFNEPVSSWWKSSNNQEGCHFTRAQQNTIIKEVGSRLASKGLTTTVSAPEEYSIDDSLASFNSYDNTAKGYISQINTHSYAGSNRSGLRAAAWNNGNNPRDLWVSEFGTGGSASHNHNDITSALDLARRVRADMQVMGVTGWVYWQAVENEAGNNNWGLIHANFSGSHDYWVTKQYWAMAQYCKLLRPGSKSVGYYGPEYEYGLTGSSYLDANGNVVIVFVNSSTNDHTVDINVAGKTVTAFKPYVTSQTENFAQKAPVSPSGYTVPAQSIVTLVQTNEAPSGIDTNAVYKIKNVNSGKLLDVTGGSKDNGTPVIQWTDNGGTNQHWRFEQVSPGVYKIKNVNSGKLLDVTGGSLDNGTPVIQWPDNDGTNQHWQMIEAGSYYKIKNVRSGKLADVNNASTADGAAVIQWPDNGGTNQQWQLIKIQ